MSRSLELQKLLKKKKGKVSSDFRDAIENERVYKKQGKKVNETSYHQIQGGAFDKIVRSKTEAEELKNELTNRGFFSYTSPKKSGYMVHGDIGPYASKEKRREEFKKLYGEQTEAKGKYLFGKPSEKREPQNMSNEVPSMLRRPEEEVSPTQQIYNLVNQKTAQAEEAARIVATPRGRKFAQQLAAKTPMNSVQRDRINQKLKNNPEELIQAQSRNLAAAEQNKKSSVKDSFMEALTFFLPQIGGMIIGSAIGGTEGAVEGGEMAAKAGSDFREYKMKREAMAQKSMIDPMELERLQVQKENLLVRQKELKLSQQRAGDIDKERDERRFERSQDRVLKQKEQFTKQEDVKKSIEQLRQIRDLENLAEVRILPGTIGFKIAKGIAGEVGNLTEEERQAAQISPSFYRRALRYGSIEFTGEIPEEDVKELKAVAKILKARTKSSLRERATKFASSRSKNLHEAHAATFRDDILLDIGVDPNEPSSGGVTDADIDKMSKEELKKYLGEK